MILTSILMGLWFFVLGAIIGSFINVVVYRMPRREGIVWRPSHCTRCGAPILAYHNIPIISWLMLRGRCHSCREPISLRYPIVELISGMQFFWIAHFQLLQDSAYRMTHSDVLRGYGYQLMFKTDWGLVGMYCFHSLLLSLVLTWTLIARDGLPIPKSTVYFALVIGTACQLMWPQLQIVYWRAVVYGRPIPDISQRLVACLLGIVLGLALGAVVFLARRPKHAHSDLETHLWNDSTIALATVGLFLGWQVAILGALVLSVTALVLSVTGCALTASPSARKHEATVFGAVVYAVAFTAVAFRSQLFRLDWLLAAEPFTAWSGIVVVVVILLSFVAAFMRPSDYSKSDTRER